MWLKNPVVSSESFNLDTASMIQINTRNPKSIKIVTSTGATKTITEEACSDKKDVAKKQYEATLKKVKAYLKEKSL